MKLFFALHRQSIKHQPSSQCWSNNRRASIDTMVRAANERTARFYILAFLWLISAVILVKNDFGVIAFVVSVLLLIYVFGLREKFDSETTASAYSVYNKDSQGITGGFTAAQLEQQLRGGILRKPNTNNSQIPVLASPRDKPFPKDIVETKERQRRREAAAAAAERRSTPKID